MNIKRAIVPFIAAIFAFAAAQAIDPEVEVKAPTSGKAGTTATATVTLKFAEGLHGYQNPPTKDYMIPVKIESATKGVTLKKIKYPAGTPMKVAGETGDVMVYAGEVKIPVEIVLPKKSGKTTVELKVSYQQCNEESCYPPATISKKLTINVKAATKGKSGK